jgi:hypothetical protein
MRERAVPPPAARLELAATTAVAGGRLGYRITNTGTAPLMLGAAYGLERLTGSGWEEVASPYGFQAWGLRLESQAHRDLVARIPDQAQPGRYRLRVRLPADQDPHPGYEWVAEQAIRPVELSAEFDVQLSEASDPLPLVS